MPYLIVEDDHDPPVTDDMLVSYSVALTPCLDVRGIRKLRTWVSDDRRRSICEFQAADTESVREAYRSAAVGFSRIWRGTLFEPGEFPDEG